MILINLKVIQEIINHLMFNKIMLYFNQNNLKILILFHNKLMLDI